MVNPAASKPPVRFLLAVWGESYIEQFLEVGLRTLLAPGNIPAMAEAYDCTFVFLTLEKDRGVFERNPAFRRLSACCPIEFVDIGDLIFGANYSATVTLAYERGMKTAGEQLCDTYFIYLVSDYVVADGAFKGLMKYMAQGYSGITAGNFQIIEENCREEIMAMGDASGIIAIPPRQLIAYGLKHLHPMTVANTVNQPFCHSLHSNRLFWRIDDSTMLGRFYLRHMICIKPEQPDYILGASCDYSFISEMCPSGNVFHINDSDDYCLVELQPHIHEQNFIREGPINQKQLTRSLSEWTTIQHRGNAHTAVIFHAGKLPVAVYDVTIESDRYIRQVEAKLPPPMPFRNHPYWTSCIEGVMNILMARSNQEQHYRNGVFAGVIGSPVFGSAADKNQLDYLLLRISPPVSSASWRRRIWHALTSLVGRPPHVFPWHPRWADYSAITSHLKKPLRQSPACLMVSSQRTPLANWLKALRGVRSFFQKSELLAVRPLAPLKEQLKEVRLIVIVMRSHQVRQLSQLFPRCLELLPEGGTLCLFISYDGGGRFKSRVASAMTICLDPRVGKVELHYVPGPLRSFLDGRISRCVSNLHRRRAVGALAVNVLQLGGLMTLYLVNNVLSLSGRFFKQFGASSAIVTITVRPAAAQAAAQEAA